MGIEIRIQPVVTFETLKEQLPFASKSQSQVMPKAFNTDIVHTPFPITIASPPGTRVAFVAWHDSNCIFYSSLHFPLTVPPALNLHVYALYDNIIGITPCKYKLRKLTSYNTFCRYTMIHKNLRQVSRAHSDLAR